MLTASHNERPITQDDASDPDRGIDLLAIMAAFVSEWLLGLITFAIVAAACLLYVFSLKPEYIATASILPQESHAEVGTIASLFGGGGSGGLYMGLLHSRSVQDATVDQAHLMDLFHTKSREMARGILGYKSSFFQGGDGIMYISVRDENAANAAMMANAYLYGLEHLNQEMALQQNREVRDVFQKQLEDEETALGQAQQEFLHSQRQTGFIDPGTQTQITLNNIAGLRSQITGLQVQLGTLLQSESEQNPDVLRLKTQIAQLRAQEGALVNGPSAPLGAAQPTSRIPETSVEYGKAQGAVAFHSEVVKGLANQYEQARLNGSTARPTFQVIDRAIPPETQAWPPRKPYIYFSLGFAAFAGALVVLFKLLFLRIYNHPEHRQSLYQLGRAFRRG